MTTEEWERVKELFEAVLDLPAPERRAVLSAACLDAPQVVHAVEELLRAHLRATAGVLDGKPTLAAPAPRFSVGDVLAGRYTILRFIASGSNGEVYEAFDDILATRIALKALNDHSGNTLDQLARFRREITVARRVAHPGL